MADRINLSRGGVTVSVVPARVDFYKKLGYAEAVKPESIEEAKAPVEEVEEAKAPAKRGRPRKGNDDGEGEDS